MKVIEKSVETVSNESVKNVCIEIFLGFLWMECCEISGARVLERINVIENFE